MSLHDVARRCRSSVLWQADIFIWMQAVSKPERRNQGKDAMCTNIHFIRMINFTLTRGLRNTLRAGEAQKLLDP